MQGVSEFCSACDALFDARSSPEQRRDADLWLTRFQTLPVAWAVSDNCLTVAASSPEKLSSDAAKCQQVVFMSAKTLRTKLQYDFEQVSSEDQMAVREKLLGHLVTLSKNPSYSVVVTQLCLALATLVIQMKEWVNPIVDLANRLSGSPSVLLELLCLIPEEHTYGMVTVDPSRRIEVSTELLEVSGQVLEFLENAFETGKLACWEKCLKCLGVWVSIVEIPGYLMCKSSLISQLFYLIETQESSFGEKERNAAVGALCAIVNAYNIPDELDHRSVAEVVIPRIIALQKVLGTAASSADFDLAIGLAQIFTCTAKSFCALLLKYGNFDLEQQLISCVLHCSESENEEIARPTWHFWHSFLMDGDQNLHIHGLDNVAFERLLRSCLNHLRLPESIDQRSTVEDLDDNTVYDRQDIADVLYACAQTAGTNHVLVRLRDSLKNMVSGRSDPNEIAGKWKLVEAVLFAADSVAESCSFSSSMPQDFVSAIETFLDVSLYLPKIALLLNDTVLCVIRSYAEYLKYSPQKLQSVTNRVLEILQEFPEVGRSATDALLRIASFSSRNMLFCGEALHSLTQDRRIPSKDRLDLVECLAKIISSQDRSMVSVGLHSAGRNHLLTIATLRKNLEEGQMSAQNAIENVGVANINFALRSLELLLKFGWDPPSASEKVNLRKGDEEHPGLALFLEVWPYVIDVTRYICIDYQIAERLAALFKISLRTFTNFFESQLEVFLSLLQDCFVKTGHSPFLYAAGICIEVFAPTSDATRKTYLLDVARAIVEKTFALFRESSMDDHPDVVEDFFISMDRLLCILPRESVSADFFPYVFRCAVTGSLMQHEHANCSLLLFLEDSMLKYKKYGVDLDKFLTECDGSILVENLITGIASAPSRGRLSNRRDGSLAMTLWTAFGAMQRPKFKQSVAEGLKKNPHLNSQVSEWFQKRLYACTDYSQFEDTLHEFAERARLRLKRIVS